MGDDLVAVEDTIISQALDLDSNSKLSNKTFEAARLQSDTDKYSIASTIGNKNAIQSIEINGKLSSALYEQAKECMPEPFSDNLETIKTAPEQNEIIWKVENNTYVRLQFASIYNSDDQ